MAEEIEERIDRWVFRMREENPLRLFLCGGIATIVCLFGIGFLVSRSAFYMMIEGLVIVGILPSGDIHPSVVDVVRSMFAGIMVSIIMLFFFVDLEEAWLRLISA